MAYCRVVRSVRSTDDLLFDDEAGWIEIPGFLDDDEVSAVLASCTRLLALPPHLRPAFVFSGHVLHSGTPNRSAAERPALHLVWRSAKP